MLHQDQNELRGSVSGSARNLVVPAPPTIPPKPAIAAPPQKPIEKPSPLARYSLRGKSVQLEQMAGKQTPLLGNLCLKGEATIFYAPPNTGKTLITLNLLMEAVRLGRIAGDKAYYVNADDSTAGLAQKTALLDEFDVHVLAPGHRSFRPSELLDLLREMTATGTADGHFVILDTLKKFMDPMNKKEAATFGAVARQFVMKGGTVLALSHTNKRPTAEGKQIYGGTSDLVDDFDCMHVLDRAGTTPSGDCVIKFDCRKSRGQVDREATYAYNVSSDISYAERIASVRPVDEYESDEPDESDEQTIIQCIRKAIGHGITRKMELARVTAQAAHTSRRKAMSVLERYTGSDPGAHHWTFAVQARGAKVFALLETDPPPAVN